MIIYKRKIFRNFNILKTKDRRKSYNKFSLYDENKMKEKLKKYKYIFIILLVSIIASIPLFRKDLDVYYDDGIQHIARAYATYLAITNGEHTEVLSSLTNGFGYSWDFFYGNFSTILILIGKCITTTFIGGYKFTLFIGLLLSRNNYVLFCKSINQK